MGKVKKLPYFKIAVIVLLLLILFRVNEAVESAKDAAAHANGATSVAIRNEDKLQEIEDSISNLKSLIDYLH